MWWSVRSRFIHLALLDRARLRRIAVRYAEHGWEVVPGACLTGRRFVCDRDGCRTRACHPALASWEKAASADPAMVTAWWQHQPHSLLLATGRAFDVLEMPAYLGRRVLDAGMRIPHRSRGGTQVGRSYGPVAVTPAGRWMFLVRPGDPLRPELDQCYYVVRHGLGSWIPAPPTRLPEGPVRWVVSPELVQWRLPDSYATQHLLVDTLRSMSPANSPAGFPGQLPLPRRSR
ncbi:bifunctional DNA primase/polymerase [Micromonospora sonneratiae]|uniref:Bifunctional DNA primase/polymerase n=1 Tax=Micromonospora sonneratiae TaxID=1184706 RepID=A0ABW3YDQ2_9ACTN